MDIARFDHFVKDLEDLNEFDNFMVSEIAPIKCINKQTNSKPPKLRRKRFNPLRELGDYEFKQKYRFSRENILKLIEIIRDDLELERPPGTSSGASNQVPVEIQVLVAIRQWGLNELPEVVADIHDITTHTLEKICRRVAAALASKASRYIRMPATLAEKEQVTKDFYAIAGFPQVIGALICYSLRIEKVLKAPQPSTLASSRSPIHSECVMNIQLISDASYKIRDFDYRLRPLSRSLKTDTHIFAETRIKERFEQHEFRGRLLLGDANCCCTSYMFIPVAISELISKKEISFNTAHVYTHTPVKKTLQLWKKRFRVMDKDVLTCTSFSGAKHLLVALAVLHNIAIDLNDSGIDFVNDIDVHNYSSHSVIRDGIESGLDKSEAVSRSAFINKYF